MLYEEYAKKIRRYARIRDNILRFKIPIICVLAAVLTAISGFLITKGIIIEKISGDSEYVYGDRLSFSAKALFSNVTYEYSNGGEWSGDEPFMPGEYQVRAVTKRSFGRNGYSEGFSFVITQRNATLTVSDKSVEWKDEPSVGAAGLAKGDTLESADTRISIEGIGNGTADVDCGSALIRNKAGDDVTAAYILSSEQTEITVVPRRITVTVNSVSREYDGTPVTADGYKVTSGTVWGDHSLNVTLSLDTLVNVGTTDVEVTGHSVFDGGVDVTQNYNVTFKEGRAAVVPRKIVISSDGASKVYDGYALALPDYSLSNSIPKCDELTVSVYDTPIIKPASKQHITGYTIKGKDGADVSANYDVSLKNGMLTVIKRKLTVNTPSDSKTYDGSVLTTYGVYTLGGDGLAENDKFAVRSYASIVNASEVNNTLYYELENSDCYDITNSFGKLTVNKRKITVSTPSTQPKEYDGEAVSTNGAYTIGGDGLASTGDFVVKGWGSYKNADTHINTLSYQIDKTNYEVSEEFGTIVITRRKIKLKTATKTAYYNGEYLEDNQPWIIEGSFVRDHYVGVQSWQSLRDVKRDADGNVIGVENKIFTWAIVSDYDGTVTSNYEVTWEYGTLTVLPLKMEILVNNITREYNAQSINQLSKRTVNGAVGDFAYIFNQSSYNCIYSVKGENYTSLIGSLTIALKSSYSGNVTDGTAFEIRWGVSNGDDITGNYDVTVTYVGGEKGLIVINPYVINVSFKDKTVIYNGKRVEISIGEYETDRAVIGGHTLTVRINGDYINYNGNGERYTLSFDVGSYTGNYKFVVSGTDGEYSTLKIKKRPLSYYTWNDDWEYDGREHSSPYITIKESGVNVGLAEAHRWYVDDSTAPYLINVGEKENKFDIRIYDGNDKDVTSNYDITRTSCGTLTVYPRAVYITSYSNEKIYDGTMLTARGASTQRVLEEHTVYIYTYATLTNVLRDASDKSVILSKENVITFEIGYWTTGENGERVWVDLTENYCYGDKGYGGTLDFGTLTVYPRPFTINTLSGTWTYDRTAHSKDEYKVSALGEFEGILAVHHLNVWAFSLNAQRTGVGYTSNSITYNEGYGQYLGLVLDAEGNDVSENYEVEFYYGRLTVEPIEITVTPKFVGVEYDNTAHSATAYRKTGNILSGDAGIIYVDYLGSGLTVGEYESTVRVVVVRDEFGFGVWYDGIMTYHVFVDTSKPMYVELDIDDYLKITSDGAVTRTSSGGDGNYRSYYQDSVSGERYEKCSYNIITKSGQISIRPRRITITCDSKTETYREGKVLTSNGCRITNGTAAEGHTVIGVASGRADKQGIKAENTVSIRDIIIMDAQNNDITLDVIDNYEFEIISGWLLMV